MWHYEITQSQHCNDDNFYDDDNMMCVSVWFEIYVEEFGG